VPRRPPCRAPSDAADRCQHTSGGSLASPAHGPALTDDEEERDLDDPACAPVDDPRTLTRGVEKRSSPGGPAAAHHQRQLLPRCSMPIRKTGWLADIAAARGHSPRPRAPQLSRGDPAKSIASLTAARPDRATRRAVPPPGCRSLVSTSPHVRPTRAARRRWLRTDPLEIPIARLESARKGWPSAPEAVPRSGRKRQCGESEDAGPSRTGLARN
jgi:hypothetical protein